MTDYPLSMPRGDSRSFQFTFKDGAGAAIDITGWILFFTVKTQYTDADVAALVTKNVTVHADPTNGITLLTINPADTDAISKGKYVYDVQIKKATGEVTTIMRGPFYIEHDVTRRISV